MNFFKVDFKNVRRAVFLILESVLISFVVIFSVMPFSCKVSTEGIQISSSEYHPPVMDDFSVVDENSVSISFSKKVQVTGVALSPYLEGVSDSEMILDSLKTAAGGHGKIPVLAKSLEDGRTAVFNFETSTEVGKSYQLYGIVEDETGNTLTFATSFLGYNPNLAKIMLTEVQIKYAKANLSSGEEFRSEFVEFLVLESGNLSGLRLFSVQDGEKKAYDFPALEVKKGEVFVLHLRTAGEGCISEEDKDLNAATGRFSTAGIRDLWSSNTTARFSDKSDVVVLKDRVSGKILDGFSYALENGEGWNSQCESMAKIIFEEGMISDSSLSGAVLNKGTSPLKSFHRECAKKVLENLKAGSEPDFTKELDFTKWEVKSVSPGSL